MRLIYILTMLLPDAAFSGSISGFLQRLVGCRLTSLLSEVRVTNPQLGQPATESASEPDTLSDMSSAIYNDERFMSIFFLATLALFFVLVVYAFDKYRKYRKFRSLAGFAGGGVNDTVDADVSGHATGETEGAGFIPTYISTDSAPAILVAEEDEEMRTFIANTLRLNYRVITAKNGLKAFRKAFEVVPDLVITNALMPGMDGGSLCHLLKAATATSHIPVIILDSEHEFGSTLPVPADGCIRPDFDARTLLIEIRSFLDQRRHLYNAFQKQLKGEDPIEPYFAEEAAFIQRLNGLVRNNYRTPSYGVDDLADGLSLTKLQLFRKLKVLINRAPGEYLRNFRVNEAKRMLREENVPVNEVASRAGFSNMSAFTKAFKEVTGTSPVEYVVETRSITDPVTD